jgi:Na+/H+ antiporter NhaA
MHEIVDVSVFDLCFTFVHQHASVTDTAYALPIVVSVTSHVPTSLRVLIVNTVFLVTMETQLMVENAFVSIKFFLNVF